MGTRSKVEVEEPMVGVVVESGSGFVWCDVRWHEIRFEGRLDDVINNEE